MFLCSCISRISLRLIPSSMQPGDLLNEFVSLMSETDWLNAKVFETLVCWVYLERLRLDGHEFGGQPSGEELLIWARPPWILFVLVGKLKWNFNAVWLDLRKVEELLIYILIGVHMWSTKIVCLSDGLLHFETVEDGERDIVGEDWLNGGVHALDDEVHSIEHLHLHTPL